MGDFTLVTEILDPAENDECDDATQLEFGVPAAGSNFAASFEDELPLCGS